MQPIKDFEEYYKIDLTDFLNQQKSRNYVYVDNTLNLYGNTLQGLSAFFNLDKIISEDDSSIDFDIDEFRKKCLIEGLDDIGLTLQKKEKITQYEDTLKSSHPWII